MVQNNLNIEKVTFKVVLMKFLAMHITNQKSRFDIFMVGKCQNIFMEFSFASGIHLKCVKLEIRYFKM